MTNDDTTRSVHVPFMGDYVSLRRNPQWKDSLRRNGLKRLDRHVVFADFANKINRSNGKASDDVWCFNNTILKDCTKPITNDCCSLVVDPIILVRHRTLHNTPLSRKLSIKPSRPTTNNLNNIEVNHNLCDDFLFQHKPPISG